MKWKTAEETSCSRTKVALTVLWHHYIAPPSDSNAGGFRQRSLFATTGFRHILSFTIQTTCHFDIKCLIELISALGHIFRQKVIQIKEVYVKPKISWKIHITPKFQISIIPTN